MMQAGKSDLHLPERWAVLEQALRELDAVTTQGDEEPGADDAGSGDHDSGQTMNRNRDSEDTRSRNQPVRPTSGSAAGGGSGSHGGTR